MIQQIMKNQKVFIYLSLMSYTMKRYKRIFILQVICHLLYYYMFLNPNIQIVTYYKFTRYREMKFRIITILLFATLSLTIFCKDQHVECPIKQNNLDMSVKNTQVLSCLKRCLKKGWNQCIYKMIELGEKDQKQQLIQILTEQRKRLQILQQQIVLGESQTQPVLKWGQNMTHIFITFKLSHRWDSPPCLNTKYQQSDLDSKNMYYENVCLVSHQKVTFILNLDFYKDVVVRNSPVQDKIIENSKNQKKQVLQNSLNETQSIENKQIISPQVEKVQKIMELQSKFQIKKDGVGTYSTILEKAKPQIWVFLDKKFTNYALWNQIGARYSSDLRTQQSLLEQYRAILKKSRKQSDIPKNQSNIKLQGFYLLFLLLALTSLTM